MTASGHISYYCFNKACKGSVYFTNSVRIHDLPLTADNLSREHCCSLCQSKLVSALDIELKMALNKKRVCSPVNKQAVRM